MCVGARRDGLRLMTVHGQISYGPTQALAESLTS